MKPRRAARAACVLAVALAAAALLAPDAARACAVCTGQDPVAVSRAMLKGTALLSLLPLALFGAIVWYVRRRARELEAARAAEREPGEADGAAKAHVA